MEVKTEEVVCGKGGTKGGTKEEGGNTPGGNPSPGVSRGGGRNSQHKMSQSKCQTYKLLVIDKANRKWIRLARLLGWRRNS